MLLTRAKYILSRKGIEISKDTISRRLKEAGYRVKVPIMKPLLSFEQMKKRLQWCTEMASKDWNSVIFTDESTFVLKKYKIMF